MKSEFVGSQTVRDWDGELLSSQSPMAVILSMITGSPVDVWQNGLPGLGISSADGTQSILKPNPIDDIRHDEMMRGFGFEKVESRTEPREEPWHEFGLQGSPSVRLTIRVDYRTQDLLVELPEIFERGAVVITALARKEFDPRCIPHLLVAGRFIEAGDTKGYLTGDPYVLKGVQELTPEELENRIEPTVSDLGAVRSWIAIVS